MKKVLLIQEVISNYRVPVYNIIAKYYDLTLMYSKGNVPEGVEFSVIKHESKKMGPFKVYKKGFSKVLKDYDVVLFLFSPTELSIIWAIIKSKFSGRRKFIPWGIGVPASYNVKYDDPQKKSSQFLTRVLIRLSDAVVFYSDYPVNKYTRLGLDRSKMFVAHNTVAIYDNKEPDLSCTQKDSILFVGSLYRQKGIGVLLEAYKEASKKEANLLPLIIIGGGDEYDSILQWISSNHLDGRIILKGAIYEEKELAGYFNRARACISPNQAGLSVQKSMGYGVPFVTKKDAITGGEIFDIVNGENGILYETDLELSDVILDINYNPEKYVIMGKNGEVFYSKFRTIDKMAQGALDAIDYVLNKGKRI